MNWPLKEQKNAGQDCSRMIKVPKKIRENNFTIYYDQLRNHRIHDRLCKG
jgi:hypothetical protein